MNRFGEAGFKMTATHAPSVAIKASFCTAAAAPGQGMEYECTARYPRDVQQVRLTELLM
jgi:hypothetical protein